MDGARGRARAAILPRVHLSRENHECTRMDHEQYSFMRRGHCFFIFRVFRMFRGYDCLAILVCIRVHSWFKNGLSCISWFPNRCFVVMTVLPF